MLLKLTRRTAIPTSAKEENNGRPGVFARVMPIRTKNVDLQIGLRSSFLGFGDSAVKIESWCLSHGETEKPGQAKNGKNSIHACSQAADAKRRNHSITLANVLKPMR